MIAKKVKVNVYGMLAEGLYSGYANADTIKNKSAYIISKKPLRDFMFGVVIAVATFKNGTEKLLRDSVESWQLNTSGGICK